MSKSSQNKSQRKNVMIGDCPRCGASITRTLATCIHCEAEFTDEEKAELTKGIPSTQASCMILLGLAALIGLFLYVIISNISSSSGKPNYEVQKLMLEQTAKQRVEAVLRDPDSAQFSGMIAKPFPEEGKGLVCGYVRSRNGFGGMSLPQRFIVTDTLFQIDGQTSAEMMQQNWDILCHP